MSAPLGVDLPRRFYERTGVVKEDGAWRVLLDGKPIRTPATALLAVPTHALAEALSAEWDAQGEHIDFPIMHLTRMANVAIDRTPEHRDGIVKEIRRHAETDLVCHLASNEDELKARQEAIYAPLRAWAGERFGIALVPTEGIIAIDQPEKSMAAAGDAAAALDDFGLTALGHGVGVLGSIVLGLALIHGEVDAQAAYDALVIDEIWQEERWGADAEALDRRKAIRADLKALEVFARALGLDRDTGAA